MRVVFIDPLQVVAQVSDAVGVEATGAEDVQFHGKGEVFGFGFTKVVQDVSEGTGALAPLFADTVEDVGAVVERCSERRFRVEGQCQVFPGAFHELQEDVWINVFDVHLFLT